MPPPKLRDVRTELSDALTAAGVRGVYSDPPGTVSPPCVIVSPDEPYLEPLTIGPPGSCSIAVRFRLLCAVSHHDSPAALSQLEQLVVDVWQAMPQGVEVSHADRPTLEQVGPSELLTTSIAAVFRASA